MNWRKGKFSKIKELANKLFELSELLQLDSIKKKEKLERIGLDSTNIDGEFTRRI